MKQLQKHSKNISDGTQHHLITGTYHIFEKDHLSFSNIKQDHIFKKNINLKIKL